MTVNRNNLLNDLRDSVIEVFFMPNTGIRPMRVTLRNDLLPPGFLGDSEQINEMTNYHDANPTFLGFWDVNNNRWAFIDITSVQYVQVVDGY